jgi:cardiolipin synthase
MLSDLNSPVQLLPAAPYITDLTQKVRQAKNRVSITCLVFIDDSTTHDLIEALIEAANRGVVVSIAADAFTYGGISSIFPVIRHFKSSAHAASVIASQFKKAGASFIWLGDMYKFNPFSGVTHIKWAVVDDICYIFGGVNLYSKGIASTDYMLRLFDTQLADTITHQQALITSHSPTNLYNGYQAPCSVGTVYVDSGKRHKSLIYDRVCELARSAETILYVSQYCPSGPLVQLLRQNNSKIYFNPPQIASIPDNLLIYWDTLREQLDTRYTRKTYLHAKFIIFTMPNGKKIAVTGSHNFSHTGVIFGTREVALETDEKTIINQLELFFQKHIA